MRTISELPTAGAAGPDLMAKAASIWVTAAQRAGINVDGLSITAPIGARLAWAATQSLAIGAVNSRYSTDMQHSTLDQVRSNLEWAAANQVYVPPELICVDEAIKGRKDDRPGLNRLKLILDWQLCQVLVLFKLSRLFRRAHKSTAFINEHVVDRGMRAVCVTQSIDTSSGKAWRLLVAMHGAMDEELLNAIADHVRAGLVGIFQNGWSTGPLPVGYMPVVVPGAPPTNRGKPRTMPGVEPKTAAMIVEHFSLIADGMPLRQGWLKWRRDGGSCDPRATTKQMSYHAYHRMLSRLDYIGIRKYCRTTSIWRGDSIQQTALPENEHQYFQSEELRIVSDELFHRVQQRLAENVIGSRIRARKKHHLWDLVIGYFHCPHCRHRFYMGCNGSMRCPCPECPTRFQIDRREAVTLVMAKLADVIKDDGDLIDMIVQAYDDVVDMPDEVEKQLDAKDRQIVQLRRKLEDMEDLLGSGDEDARQRRRQRIRQAEAELSGLELERIQLRRRRDGEHANGQSVTPDRVKKILTDMLELLDMAARGDLGDDMVYRAADVFGLLVGGRIEMFATRRPGRKMWIIDGHFKVDVLKTVEAKLGVTVGGTIVAPTLVVPLRSAPRVDRIADEVQAMYDNQRLGFRIINTRLEAKYGGKIGSGNICAAYRRWY